MEQLRKTIEAIGAYLMLLENMMTNCEALDMMHGGNRRTTAPHRVLLMKLRQEHQHWTTSMEDLRQTMNNRDASYDISRQVFNLVKRQVIGAKYTANLWNISTKVMNAQQLITRTE